MYGRRGGGVVMLVRVIHNHSSKGTAQDWLKCMVREEGVGLGTRVENKCCGKDAMLRLMVMDYKRGQVRQSVDNHVQ